MPPLVGNGGGKPPFLTCSIVVGPDYTMSSILIRNGKLVTMDAANTIVRGDLLINGEHIAAVGGSGETAETVIDADGCAVIPGFVQTHIHLCQTIFRGAADDLAR